MPQNTAKGAAKYPGGSPWDMVQHPVLCDPSVQQSSGYISVSSRTKHLFYWFFESRAPSHSNTPVILWLNGGPGCSSMTGLLTGIGPCRVTSDGHGTTWNPFGWNKDAHLLFLDQPANSGYSYGANVTSTWDAASDVAEFLQTFYQKFPQYRGPLHVMGESYAAHYVPAIAAQLLLDSNTYTPLTSIAVGNGLFDIARQFAFLPQMACNSTYATQLSDAQCLQMQDANKLFMSVLKTHQNSPNVSSVEDATRAAYNILQPYEDAGGNPYDVRRKCVGGALCDPYLDAVDTYADQLWVRLNIGIPPSKEFEVCNADIKSAFIESGDELINTARLIPGILRAGVRVLNYAGDADLICNWYGNKAVMEEVEWEGREGFKRTPDVVWTVGGEAAGEARSFGGLTFLRVFEAGHMVALDKAQAALAMVSEWLQYGTVAVGAK
ncbi:hypothetical protein EC988_005250 [Linderina pennispora]|nr:hypothetical protein EC988_005250 [Linderina pennispora]